MTGENKFAFILYRVKRMSYSGFLRLSRKARSNFKKEVYKPLGKVSVPLKSVCDERTLAYWLLAHYGAGTYSAQGWVTDGSNFTKQLFKVLVYGNLGERWGYDYVHSRGMSRYAFWVKDEW